MYYVGQSYIVWIVWSHAVYIVCVTRVVGQQLGGPVLTGVDQVPDEALDVLVSTVMQQAVGQQRSADLLHIRLLQGSFEATVSQDVIPPTPPAKRYGEQKPVSGYTVFVYQIIVFIQMQ